MSVTIMALVWQNGPTKASDRLMLLALADNSDDYGLAWPGMARLAEKCCVQPDAARATVRRLEADGWITVVRGGGTRDGVHGLPNRYQLDLSRLRKPTPPSEGGYQIPTPPSGPSYPPVDTVPTPPWTGGEPSVEPSVEPSEFMLIGESEDAPATDPIGDEFVGFWKAYPRKTGKAAAEKAFRRARRTHSLDVIRAGFVAQLPAFKQAEPRFVPHAATWLNGERWTDELPPGPDAAAPGEDPTAWMRRRPAQ